MKILIPAVGALLFAAASFAQTPPAAEASKGPHQRFDCSKAQDPKTCEERRAKFHERRIQRLEEVQKMHEACNGKRGDELVQCLHEHRPARGKPKN